MLRQDTELQGGKQETGTQHQPTHSPEPKWSKQWEQQSSPVLAGCQHRHTPPTASAPQIFILIFQHPLGMQDVLPAFSLDLHPAFFLSFRGATPLHVPCGKAGVVIFTAEKTSKAVERDVGEKCEWNPLASQDRCAHRVSEGHSIGAVQKWSGTGEAARGWEVAVH